MMEQENINTDSKQEIKHYTNTIEPIDGNLNLPEDNKDLNITPDINNNINPSPLNIKKRLSIEILRQIMRDQNISYEEKEKINKLIQEIRDKDYTMSYSDFNGANDDLVQSLNQNKQVLEDPGVLKLPNSLDYDIELYKIGRKCHGLKGRYGIIKNGKLYSSDKPLQSLKEKDFEKLKDKTDFLKDAEIIKEFRDLNSGGEWPPKDKQYRIRINYQPDPEKKEKEKESTITLYFQDEHQMKEVELALYNISKPVEFKTKAKTICDNLNNIFLKGKRLYTILKILSVKNKIKKRKATFLKVENITKQKINAKFKEEFLNNQIVNESIKINEPINKSENSSKYKVRGVNKPNEFRNEEIPLSDFMPLISKASTTEDQISMKKSLNNMINQYNLLKNEIPEDIINEAEQETNRGK